MAQKKIADFDLILIGGSAGSLEVILKLLPSLPRSFPVPVLIVVHRGNNADTGFIQLLASRTVLTVKEAEEKEMIRPGFIYVAPSDYHLLIEADHTLSLDVSEKVNYSRPSIDVSFESAAMMFTTKLLCILLSGANADGASGAAFAKSVGSMVIVQHPHEAQVPYMPLQAIAEVGEENVMTINEIIFLLTVAGS